MEHKIKIDELIKRPIIRNDQIFEFLNKMTDDEIEQYYHEIYLILENEGWDKKFPDINAGSMSKIIDTDILYNILKLK